VQGIRHVTSDPQLGTDQKARQFWGNVKAVFEDLLARVDDNVVERGQMALMPHTEKCQLV
jgi:hypothetical protein